jgi:hypothetical protein
LFHLDLEGPVPWRVYLNLDPTGSNPWQVLLLLEPLDPAENPAPANTSHDPIHKMSETSYKNDQLVFLMIRQIISGSKYQKKPEKGREAAAPSKNQSLHQSNKGSRTSLCARNFTKRPMQGQGHLLSTTVFSFHRAHGAQLVGPLGRNSTT